MLLLGAIGDIRRFDAAHKLVGYAGLGARVHCSGEQNYGGRITKQGRRDIRSTMIEAAWVAVGSHPDWKELFERLAFRIGKPKGDRCPCPQDAAGGLARVDQARSRPEGGRREGRSQIPGVVVEAESCQ
jgi:hypothetical protein